MGEIPSTPPLKSYLPKQEPRTYSAIGVCIYCGSMEGLTDEHIVPLGFGGRWLLPKSSCKTCAAETSKHERTCLRTMYGPLRLLYDLPSRRKADRPDSLPLKVKRTEAHDWEYIQVPQERFPFLLTFPHFGFPGIFGERSVKESAGPVVQHLWIRGASPSYNFDNLVQELISELQVFSVMPESKAEIPAFCSVLAKIAYSFLVAELGKPLSQPPIAPYAIGKELSNCRHYIGSVPFYEPPTEHLHELSVHDSLATGLYQVRIRLFAKLGTPTYLVAVPHSTEHQINA